MWKLWSISMSVTGSKTSTGMKNHYALDKSIESLKISKKKNHLVQDIINWIKVIPLPESRLCRTPVQWFTNILLCISRLTIISNQVDFTRILWSLVVKEYIMILHLTTYFYLQRGEHKSFKNNCRRISKSNLNILKVQ